MYPEKESLVTSLLIYSKNPQKFLNNLGAKFFAILPEITTMKIKTPRLPKNSAQLFIESLTLDFSSHIYLFRKRLNKIHAFLLLEDKTHKINLETALNKLLDDIMTSQLIPETKKQVLLHELTEFQ
jgi:hypothetical protein